MVLFVLPCFFKRHEISLLEIKLFRCAADVIVAVWIYPHNNCATHLSLLLSLLSMATLTSIDHFLWFENKSTLANILSPNYAGYSKRIQHFALQCVDLLLIGQPQWVILSFHFGSFQFGFFLRLESTNFSVPEQ